MRSRREQRRQQHGIDTRPFGAAKLAQVMDRRRAQPVGAPKPAGPDGAALMAAVRAQPPRQ